VRVSYEALKEELGNQAEVHREGTLHEYLSSWCPFHEDDLTPSLLVYPIDREAPGEHDGYWRCLAGCGSGSIVSVIRKIRLGGEVRTRKGLPSGLKYDKPYLPEDLDALAVKADTAHAILRKFSDLGWYLEQRGLRDRIEPCELGYLDGWISIPVYDSVGDLETVVLRSTPPVQEATGLRFHSPQLPPKLYAPNWVSVLRSDVVYIVFGMLDALSLDEIGKAVVCATHGNVSLNPVWFAGSKMRQKKYILLSDEPQHEWEEVREKYKAMWQLGLDVHMGQLPYREGIKDPNDILRVDGPSGLHRALEGVRI